MNVSESAPVYYVWKGENTPDGPMELPALVSYIKSGKGLASSWIFTPEGVWRVAKEISELRGCFQSAASPSSTAGISPSDGKLKPGALRRIKIFADMDDSQLEIFLKYVEMLKFRQFSTVVHKGDFGDAMYLVLEGELRARTLIDGRETILATLGPGEFFGEISLLDQGPRSADVLANRDSIVLKISAEAIQKILSDAPAAAAPFLYALGRSLVGRIRALTKRYEDSIHFSRLAGMVTP